MDIPAMDIPAMDIPAMDIQPPRAIEDCADSSPDLIWHISAQINIREIKLTTFATSTIYIA
jgi:hypothetical protein